MQKPSQLHPPACTRLLMCALQRVEPLQLVVFIHISEINGSSVLALKIFSSAELPSAEGGKLEPKAQGRKGTSPGLGLPDCREVRLSWPRWSAW